LRLHLTDHANLFLNFPPQGRPPSDESFTFLSSFKFFPSIRSPRSSFLVSLNFRVPDRSTIPASAYAISDCFFCIYRSPSFPDFYLSFFSFLGNPLFSKVLSPPRPFPGETDFLFRACAAHLCTISLLETWPFPDPQCSGRVFPFHQFSEGSIYVGDSSIHSLLFFPNLG